MINFQIHRYGANYSKRIILVIICKLNTSHTIKLIIQSFINFDEEYIITSASNDTQTWKISPFFSPFVKVTISWKYLSILYFVYLSFYLSFNMVTLNLYKITKKCWEKITNRTLELNSNCQLKFLPLIFFIGFKIKLPRY